MLPTIDKCLDGHNHSWQSGYSYKSGGVEYEQIWCAACGCRSETADGEVCDGDNEGEKFIEIPKYLRDAYE